jgi:PAS domain S-box-containing protein
MTGYRLINEHYEELQEILDCIKVGIYIADSKGNTLMLNRESEKTGGMTRDELIGKNMKDLIEIGYVSESAIIKVLASQREEQIIQELGEGGQMFITGVPLIRDGKVDLVVCTERDITETINLKELLKMSEEKVEKYGSELEYHRKMNLDIGGRANIQQFSNEDSC